MVKVYIVQRGEDVVGVFETLENAKEHKQKEDRLDRLVGPFKIVECEYYKKCKVKSRWQN